MVIRSSLVLADAADVPEVVDLEDLKWCQMMEGLVDLKGL